MIKLKYKMHAIKKEDELFPWRIKILDDCPDIIYVLGNKNILNDFSIAVVGSRDCDDYGKEVTSKLVSELIKREICVVSGLAEGIDTVAHSSAVEQHGKTIAIIGNGFEDIYPASNKKLVDKIIESGGAIITEYLPDQQPLKHCFPHRNRLVACMTEGTLVTEAREGSGAFITANIAKRYNKKLFAVPGDINNEKCSGSNFLIKAGSKIVLNVKDILDEFPGYKYTLRKEVENTEKIVSEKYKRLYGLIGEKSIHINEICKLSGGSMQKIMSDLTMLEMDNFIESMPGGYYKKHN